MDAANRLFATVQALTRLVGDQAGAGEAIIVKQASQLIRELVKQDDWLPTAMAEPHPTYYQQHLLYGDPLERFSLVSFVWGPGQATPIHNHTVWGIIGMLRGAELAQQFQVGAGTPKPLGSEVRLAPGDVETVSPTLGDVHRVRNAFDDRVSISIHLYGGNIGRIHRSVFDAVSGAAKPFVSGYSNALCPNLWATPRRPSAG